MLKKIKAVIFDLDGVITETSDLHTKAWKKMADEENIPFEKETIDKLRGVSRQKSMNIILEDAKNKYGFTKTYTEEQFNELMDRKNNYYIKSLSSLGPDNIFPGMPELMAYLKDKGYKLAIGSSSKNAEAVIQNLQIGDQLQAIVNGTEIKHGKPDPEIFIKAADRLGIPPEQCVVVEDAASGVESANAGGMISIGIGPEIRFKEENQKPDFRFDDIKSFNEKKEELFEILIPEYLNKQN